MQFHRTQLSNGLTIVGETNPAALSVAVGFFVRTGARDEAPDVSGVSHYLEHMVFKGTPRRTALEVNRDFDAMGANYNAFTSEENTVFYAAVLPDYLTSAVDVLADILRPSLRVEDFDVEKNVILEEISRRDDQPTSATFDAAHHEFFGDHPLGNSVLGSKVSVTHLTRDQMAEYHARRYVASNVTVAVAGNFDWKRFVPMLEEHCGRWPTGPAPRQTRPTAGTGSFKVLPKATVTQEHVILISAGPAADSELRYAAEVVANAVGDDSGSRFYWALVDPGMADSAEMSFHEFEGCGAIYSYLSGEAGRTQENLEIATRVLRDVQRDGLTEEEIRQAKSKLGSRVVRAGERPMGRMQALGFSWTYLKQYRTVDDDLAAIDAVTPKQVRDLLDRFPIDRLTIVAHGPVEQLHRPGDNGDRMG